ncbi:unnamed protein product [Urochloa humidicola]
MAAASAIGSRSTSTVIAEKVTGWHVLKVEGYSNAKELGVGEDIKSPTFTIGDHIWSLSCYPAGIDDESAHCMSVGLNLEDPASKGVKARFEFSLLDHAGEPVPSSTKTSNIRKFSIKQQSWAFYNFIIREVLEANGVRDDSFQIRCHVTILKKFCVNATPMLPSDIPSPDLHKRFCELLTNGFGGDVTFRVAGKEITAHRCILAARSPVFKAELFGPLKEKNEECIGVDDMEARVFKAMLHFIYTDTLPEMEERDEMAMAQHLLIAADRYCLVRLKSICENMLRICMTTSTVANTLILAEQLCCHELKEACFMYLKTPGVFKAVMASDRLDHLMGNCPSLFRELLTQVAP